MEEIKNDVVKTTPEVIEPSCEEVKMMAAQWQQRAMMLENRLRSIDMVAVRLDYLFKVLENKDAFSKDYIEKCSTEIMETLTIDAPEGKVSE